MNRASSLAHPPTREHVAASTWTAVLVPLAVAVLLRALGYPGFFGSDEVTYTASGFRIAQGDWSVDPYVGAHRMGVNLPVAAFASLLGATEPAAALWSLLASVAEVVLVAWAGARMFGARTGLWAGLLLAALPIHVHFAGRLMADAPLALTITAAFVCFYEGERRRWAPGWFLAGVFAGLSFWVKPVTLFVFAVFAAWPLVSRRIDRGWLWLPLGAIAAMAANGLLFYGLTDRFWYVFEAMRARQTSGYLEAGTEAGEIAADAHYYLVYLFGKVYHTAAAGWLALAGAWVLLRPLVAGAAAPLAAPTPADAALARRFVVFWAVSLLLILSLLPVRLNPLVLVPKQTNYMLIFAAPLALLSGIAMATLQRRHARLSMVLGLLALAAGTLLALLQQANVAVFTANSHATVALAQQRPQATLFVMSNAYRAAQFAQLTGTASVMPRVHSIGDWRADGGAAAATAADERLAVVDEETFSWDGHKPFASPEAVPACWQPVGELRGRPHGLGAALARAMRTLLVRLPGLEGSAVDRRLRRMHEPAPARIYRLPAQPC